MPLLMLVVRASFQPTSTIRQGWTLTNLWYVCNLTFEQQSTFMLRASKLNSFQSALLTKLAGMSLVLVMSKLKSVISC